MNKQDAGPPRDEFVFDTTAEEIDAIHWIRPTDNETDIVWAR